MWMWSASRAAVSYLNLNLMDGMEREAWLHASNALDRRPRDVGGSGRARDNASPRRSHADAE
jgi:hypothetical protein